MIKKEYKTKNYLGQEMLYTCHFNLNRVELKRIDAKHSSLADRLAAIVEINEPSEMFDVIDELIKTSYGVLTTTGNIVKKQEYLDDFVGSPAYENLFEELSTDASKMVEFVKGVIPEEYRKEIEKNQALIDQQLKEQNVTQISAVKHDTDNIVPLAVPVQ